CLFNPRATGLRATQQASDLDKVRKKLGTPRTSPGSLSAAARASGPEPLQAAIAERAAEARPPGSGRGAEVSRGLAAADGPPARVAESGPGLVGR
ncbi:MAG TPA: hypothetical protein VH092_09425, partial [Urbifossiella sp.]|nr:hypothetical protein [Urbifossiella sp.]